MCSVFGGFAWVVAQPVTVSLLVSADLLSPDESHFGGDGGLGGRRMSTRTAGLTRPHACDPDTLTRQKPRTTEETR